MSLPETVRYPLPTAAELPAPSVDWRPDPARSALLVHDLQHHFLRPFDRAAEPLSTALPAAAALVRAAREHGIPVFYTAQPAHQTPEQRGLLTDFWGEGIGADEQAARIVDEVAPADGDTVLTKWRYDAFARTDLAQRLTAAGRDQLVVVGVFTHIGVLATATRAFMDDVQAFVPADATADFSREDHDMALAYVAGRCGVVTTTDAVLSAWHAGPDTAAAGRPAAVPTTVDEVVAAVADSLGIDPAELEHDSDLVAAGLDSVRVMGLAEQWSEGGDEIGFMDLLEDPTPRGLLAVVDRAHGRLPA